MHIVTCVWNEIGTRTSISQARLSRATWEPAWEPALAKTLQSGGQTEPDGAKDPTGPRPSNVKNGQNKTGPKTHWTKTPQYGQQIYFGTSIRIFIFQIDLKIISDKLLLFPKVTA